MINISLHHQPSTSQLLTILIPEIMKELEKMLDLITGATYLQSLIKETINGKKLPTHHMPSLAYIVIC